MIYITLFLKCMIKQIQNNNLQQKLLDLWIRIKTVKMEKFILKIISIYIKSKSTNRLKQKQMYNTTQLYQMRLLQFRTSLQFLKIIKQVMIYRFQCSMIPNNLIFLKLVFKQNLMLLQVFLKNIKRKQKTLNLLN